MNRKMNHNHPSRIIHHPQKSSEDTFSKAQENSSPVKNDTSKMSYEDVSVFLDQSIIEAHVMWYAVLKNNQLRDVEALYKKNNQVNI